MATTCTQRKKARSAYQPTGRWIRPEKRLAIYLRDGFACLYCGRDLHDADPRDVTLDHRTPKAAGGSNDASNLITSCRACNCSRQDKGVASFATPDAAARIRRHLRRSLAPYARLAKALIEGRDA